MSWLRIDDGFAAHPKITALTDRELRVWIRTLCYSARYQTDGLTSHAQHTEIPGFTRTIRDKFVRLQLLHEEPDGIYSINDWGSYAPKDPTSAARQKRFRAHHRNGDSNGKRNGESNGGDRDETVPLTRVPAARVPVPSLEPLPNKQSVERPVTEAADEKFPEEQEPSRGLEAVTPTLKEL